MFSNFSHKNKLDNRGVSKAEVILVSSIVLVVVAIIIAFMVGSLAGSSKDANMIENMRSLRKESEIFYLENGRSYKDFCFTETVEKINRKTRNFVCYDSVSDNSFGEWAAEYKLTTEDKYYCADYRGKDGFTQKSSISHKDFLCDLEVEESNIEIEEEDGERRLEDYLK